jgi:tetratricopeptide (TPR) repeat protein
MNSVEHQQAQELAARAGLLAQDGRWAEALPLYERAAEWEKKALDQVPPDRVRTRGILGVSLASMLYKARSLERAETTIHALLSQSDLPPAARQELRDLLKAIWDEQAAIATWSPVTAKGT